MKTKSIVLLVFTILYVFSFADNKITRGPDIGEIYYIGPTVTQFNAIYHSTDFGETATCMDSISEVISICADLTPGSLYRTRMPDVLYYSNNFGQYSSWVFRSNNITSILSGRNEGYIFNGMASHSEEYGMNFIDHANNGYFGSTKAFEIDNQDNVGYAITKQYSVYDSLWLLVSFDNFENFENQYVFNWNQTNNISFTRGYEQGELYLLKAESVASGDRVCDLWYSNDYGENWIFKNHLLSDNIVGGRQPGELFVLASYMQLLGDIRHIFIYHSLDFGETFTVYHPFAYGPEPYYANFEATPLEGSVPLTVQFTDLSSGEDIQSWEWDFDNDGIIDSYVQNPEFTYQYTGYHSVKLRIVSPFFDDAFVKTNYIHAMNGSYISDYELGIMNYALSNYPNPFNPTTTISFSISNDSNVELSIFNIKGQKTKALTNNEFTKGSHSVIWNGNDASGKKVGSGVYLYKLNVNDKTELVKKCLLLK